MAFNSYEFFFVLLPLTFLLHLIFRTTPFRNVVILIASYIFYAWGKPYLLVLILFSSTIDYFVGLKIFETTDQKQKKLWLLLSLTINLGLLFSFKYLNWITFTLKTYLPYGHFNQLLPLTILPVLPGISFYTFQALSYTIDVYRGELAPSRNIIDFFTYIAFFPHLVAGPIQRKPLLFQLSQTRERANSEKLQEGFFLVCWGLTKKLVFADNLSNLLSQSLRSLAIPGMGLISILAFCFQIYFDFSAYSDIARGSAKFFNVDLTRNFLTPYFATSPRDFWRRWHITLSTWLRDYLYIPLGGSQKGTLRKCFNLLITMILGGLWHGSGFLFLLWGLYHGFLLIIYHLLPIDVWLVKFLGVFGKMISIVIMFIFVCFGWALFMSVDFSQFSAVILSVRNFFMQSINPELYPMIYGLALFTLPLILTEFCAYRHQSEFVDLYPRFPDVVKVLMFICMFYAVVLLGRRETCDFIYYAF